MDTGSRAGVAPMSGQVSLIGLNRTGDLMSGTSIADGQPGPRPATAGDQAPGPVAQSLYTLPSPVRPRVTRKKAMIVGGNDARLAKPAMQELVFDDRGGGSFPHQVQTSSEASTASKGHHPAEVLGTIPRAPKMRHANQPASVVPTAHRETGIGSEVQLQPTVLPADAPGSDAQPLQPAVLLVIPKPPNTNFPTAAVSSIGKRRHLHGAVRRRSIVSVVMTESSITIVRATPALQPQGRGSAWVPRPKPLANRGGHRLVSATAIHTTIDLSATAVAARIPLELSSEVIRGAAMVVEVGAAANGSIRGRKVDEIICAARSSGTQPARIPASEGEDGTKGQKMPSRNHLPPLPTHPSAATPPASRARLAVPSRASNFV